MDSAKNVRWIIPFKKFDMVMVKAKTEKHTTVVNIQYYILKWFLKLKNNVIVLLQTKVCNAYSHSLYTYGIK